VDVCEVLFVTNDEKAHESLAASLQSSAISLQRIDVFSYAAQQKAFELVLFDVRTQADAVAFLASPNETNAVRIAVVPESLSSLAEAWLDAGGEDFSLSPACIGLAQRIRRAKRARRQRDEQSAIEDSLRAGTSALLKFARSAHFLRGENIEQALSSLVEIAVYAMRIERATVWRFDASLKTLTMVEGYDARTERHENGRVLLMDEHPEYLSALKNQSIVSAADVANDPRMRSFAAALFASTGVASSLDVVIRQRGEPVGVLCFEKAGVPTPWTATQEVFGGALADVLSLTLETAERFRTDEALHDSERRFREVFQHSNDAIIIYRVSIDGGVFLEDINPAGERIVGLTRNELVGRSAPQVLTPESAEKLTARFRQCIAERAPIVYDHELTIGARKVAFHTSLVPLIDEHGRVYRLAAVARDMSVKQRAENVQRQLEAQLAEAQKNDALARLAAHVAHDFNNLLTVVSAHASRLENLSGLAKEVGEKINQASTRGRELTQQILAFGRKKPPATGTFNLTDEVKKTLGLLAATAPHIVFRENLGTNALVTADRAQVHQVLTNLTSNAIEAMGPKGTLQVSIAPVEVDDALARAHPPLSPGRWICLTVKDTGVGMDSVTKKRIFEPYFTNRSTGGGTGLGLTVVQGIVLGFGGVITVESELGRGSTFSVFIPEAQAVPAGAHRPGEGKHLILVDDHLSMAKVSGKLLETLGYRLSVFDDPREALTVFLSHPARFDAVLTDLAMPQMGGDEFIRSLHSVRPELPVVVASGRLGGVGDDYLKSLGALAVLAKPWRLEEADAILRRVLSI
jgi:PAS domain S-box-containing protein